MRVLNTSTILVGQFRGSAYGVCAKNGRTDGGWHALRNEHSNRPQETLRYIDSCRVQFAEQFKRTPVILTPAAMGPAPNGLASTGDPRMNAPWTALGTPAVSIPMPVGTALPLGLQLTAEPGGEARVLRTAVRLQNKLGSQPI
jgi:Asp-tRNA(Asn)/Glu-tRNA(Gln) amidotransferase A subunit family amidase